MLIGSLLPPPPPNVHRVPLHHFSMSLNKEYPQILRGIMQEGEYHDYIKRIEKEISISKKPFLLPIIPFLIFAAGVACITATGMIPFIALIMFGMIAFMATWISVVVYITRKNMKGIKKMTETLTEINQRFYSRGAKWVCNSIRTGKNGVYQYIEIITFTPGAQGVPPMEGAFFEIPYYSSAPGVPGAYPGTPAAYPAAPGAYPGSYPAAPAAPGAYPAAPPPSKDAYMSKDAYPGAPGVQPGYEDGPNPYEKYPQGVNPYPGTYPGDPTNPNNY